MEKEKKIVESTIQLQQFLFKFKNYCRDLPKEISTKQSNELLLESAKCIMLCRKQEESLMRLVNSIKPEIITKRDLEEMNAKNGLFENILKLIQLKKSEEEQEE